MARHSGVFRVGLEKRPMGQDGPVFIAGCGRSGTTYLKTVVDAHPDVFIPTESLFIADYLRYHSRGRPGHMPRRLLERLFFGEPQLRAWYEGPRFAIPDAAALPEAIARAHRHAAAAAGAAVWGQKTPRFVRHMALFERAFPGCRWILICRDPRAVAASMLQSPRHTYSIRSACRRWVRDNQPIVAHLQADRPAENVMVIRYEDLVRDFDANLKRVFDFLGLAPLSAEEVFRRGQVREYKGSGFSVQANTVREGLRPQPERLESWRQSLTAAQVRQIERRCAREMAALGYRPLENEAEALPDRPFEKVRDLLSPAKDLMIVAEYLRHWPAYPIHTGLRKLAMSVPWKKAVKWTLFVAVLAFVLRELIARFGQVSWGRVDFLPAYVLASLGCLCLSSLFLAASFRYLVGAMSRPAPSWPAMCGITWVPRLGKYVPGKAASVVGVVWLLCRQGVPLATAGSAVLVRSVVVTVMSFMVAAPVALWPQIGRAIPGAWLWCVSAIVGGAALLHPKVLSWATNLALRKLKRAPLERFPRARDYPAPLAATFLQWLFFGLGLFFAAKAVAGDSAHWSQWPVYVSAAALASAMGFVTVFAPAGLGVQEGILLAVLTPLLGGSMAAVAAVLLRLLQTLTDVAMAGAGVLLMRDRKRQEATA